MRSNSYYDVDAILAEEELIPCSTNLDFAHLAHLDPDHVGTKQSYLPESSRIKMPLWGVEKWALLGYVRLSLPRHFSRKARERLEADPSEVDLRKRNERFFLAGRRLIHLIENHTTQVAEAIRKSNKRGTSRRQLEALEQLTAEAKHLRQTLLSTFTGSRLSQTLNWALSSVGDDVTAYTSKLTQLELRLFQSASLAACNHTAWKIYGHGHYLPRPRTVSPDTTASNKRRRLS